MPKMTADQAGGSNVCAFLDMIAWSELGYGLIAKSDDGYNVLVGATPQRPLLFTSYAQHPQVHNAKQDSDAAGRYQFMGKYWDHYRDQLSLPDFGPMSQDIWAIQLIKECHALGEIQAGRLTHAVDLCRSRWASFPKAGYDQNEHAIEEMQRAYLAAGGKFS